MPAPFTTSFSVPVLLVMNTDNFHMQQTIHLQTVPTVYMRFSDPNPDCNLG